MSADGLSGSVKPREHRPDNRGPHFLLRERAKQYAGIGLFSLFKRHFAELAIGAESGHHSNVPADFVISELSIFGAQISRRLPQVVVTRVRSKMQVLTIRSYPLERLRLAPYSRSRPVMVTYENGSKGQNTTVTPHIVRIVDESYRDVSPFDAGSRR